MALLAVTESCLWSESFDDILTELQFFLERTEKLQFL